MPVSKWSHAITGILAATLLAICCGILVSVYVERHSQAVLDEAGQHKVEPIGYPP